MMLDDVRPHPALQDGDPFRPSGPDPALLIRRAGELLDAGRLGAVRPLLAALERLGAPAGELALLQARLAVQENRLDDARTALDAAVDAAPDDPVLRKARADVRFRLKLFTGAAQDAAEAVILDSRDPQAKAQLGAMLLALGRAADALRCLAEAVAASPLNPAYRESLAAAEEMNGDPEAAIATLEAGTALMPRAVSLRRALMRIWLRLGNAESAAAVAAAARREGVVDSGLLALTGQALIMLDLEDAAMEAFAEAAKLAPEDPTLRRIAQARLLAESRPADDPVRIRAEAEASASWDERQALSRGYRVPGLMRAALIRHVPVLTPAGSSAEAARIGPALDLGCGSGLLAVALSDLPIGRLVGVDLSPAMLAAADAKSLYAELHESEMLAFLAAEQRGFAVILAAGVLQYMADPAPLFARVAQRLLRGGLFIVSAEARPASGAAADGRFGHSADAIRRAAEAAMLRVVALDDATIRNERGAPVDGALAVLTRDEACG